MTADPFKQLDVIRSASAKGYPITDCYRLMYKPQLVRLKHLPRIKDGVRVDAPGIDVMVNTMRYATRTELEQRLMANRCEACGATAGLMQVHHVRKLKDLRKKPNLSWYERLMIERARKTLVLCADCHRLHHGKQIPINQLESRIRGNVSVRFGGGDCET